VCSTPVRSSNPKDEKAVLVKWKKDEILLLYHRHPSSPAHFISPLLLYLHEEDTLESRMGGTGTLEKGKKCG
jgi:hypothetical protein